MRNITIFNPERKPSTKCINRLEKSFPTFIVKKNTGSELGKKIKEMGYDYNRHANGVAYRMKEI